MSSPLISLGKPYQFLVITASFSKFWGEKSIHIYTDTYAHIYMGFPDGSDGKESACNAGVTSLTLGSGRPPGKGKGHPLQDSCLENSMDRGSWWATVQGVTESQTQLND